MRQTTVTDLDTYYSATTKTLTNKTMTLHQILTSTTAQLNSALSDGYIC